MYRYDQDLIIRDFNIHVCCREKPQVMDFLDLVDSVNLIKSVNSPTQECGNTLGLVLSYCLSVLNSEIGDALFSDHMTVLFNFVLLSQSAKPCTPACLCQTVVELVASLEIKKAKSRSELWLDDNNRAMGQECRRAERRWKKDRLQVSLEMLRETCSYKKAMKAARSKFFSDIIASNSYNSLVLFNTLNYVLNVYEHVH